MEMFVIILYFYLIFLKFMIRIWVRLIYLRGDLGIVEKMIGKIVIGKEERVVKYVWWSLWFLWMIRDEFYWWLVEEMEIIFYLFFVGYVEVSYLVFYF